MKKCLPKKHQDRFFVRLFFHLRLMMSSDWQKATWGNSVFILVLVTRCYLDKSLHSASLFCAYMCMKFQLKGINKSNASTI